jgi:hypothetical protein
MNENSIDAHAIQQLITLIREMQIYVSYINYVEASFVYSAV